MITCNQNFLKKKLDGKTCKFVVCSFAILFCGDCEETILCFLFP